MINSRWTAAKPLEVQFCADLVFGGGEAGDIAARPSKTFDKASCDRIGGLREHDGYGPSSLKQRFHDRSTRGQDDIRPKRNQLTGKLLRNIRTPPAASIMDSQILTFCPP